MYQSGQRVAVGPTPHTGKGLFAAASIRKGTRIIEYTGARVPTPVADTLKTRYLFEVDERWTIDAEDERHTARYINHSCTPNAEARIENGRVFMYASGDIGRGEEITIDYGGEYFDEFIRPDGCKCRHCLAPLRAPTARTVVYSRV